MVGACRLDVAYEHFKVGYVSIGHLVKNVLLVNFDISFQQ
jgi:hypothetical protein